MFSFESYLSFAAYIIAKGAESIQNLPLTSADTSELIQKLNKDTLELEETQENMNKTVTTLDDKISREKFKAEILHELFQITKRLEKVFKSYEEESGTAKNLKHLCELISELEEVKEKLQRSSDDEV